MNKAQSERHPAPIIAIHWITAILMIILVIFGEEMVESERGSVNPLFGVHVAMGVTILALTILRIAIKLGTTAPPMPADSKPWERFAAHAMAGLFYIALLVLPLSGWLTASAGRQFAGGSIPMIGGLALPSLPTGINSFLNEAGEIIHVAGGKLMIAAIILHVLAALKHHFINRDDVFTRMLPRWAGGR